MTKILKKLSAYWRTDETGTTAIEFSMLAVPYVYLVMGIIELACADAAASLLERATGVAARTIRTGQLQQSGAADPQQAFLDTLCGYTGALIDCNAVQIEVVTMSSYGDFATIAPTYDAEGRLVSRGFDAGGANDRILIRVAYQYTMMTPLMGRLLGGPDGKIPFMSTIVLQTEPYNFGS